MHSDAELSIKNHPLKGVRMEKRVACYARTSTLDQATGLESQVRVLQTYCEQNGITNAEFFSDGGVSGTKSSRPALDLMMAAVGVAIFSILASISQLERDLIADRVKCGLANARAKGKLIGRKKMRDSDLIRKLLKSELSFRAVSSIAKCSHGSVSAEKKAMKRDEEELKKKIEKQGDAEKKLQETAIVFPEMPKENTPKI